MWGARSLCLPWVISVGNGMVLAGLVLRLGKPPNSWVSPQFLHPCVPRHIQL